VLSLASIERFCARNLQILLQDAKWGLSFSLLARLVVVFHFLDELDEAVLDHMTTKYHVVLADIHYPEHDAKALKAVFEFIRKSKTRIASLTLLGDALDCANLSRHTKGKPRLRKHRGY
jgi:hypothetical protein